MEPKFQSSFIPKGPVVSASGAPGTMMPKRRQKSLLAFIAIIIFTLSVLAAAAAFGYKLYLNYTITGMSAELEAGRASVEEQPVTEIIRLNNRLIATESLLNSHIALSPLFKYLEESTLQAVRMTEFRYELVEGELRIYLNGQAANYTSLALQADVFNEGGKFSEAVFSDLNLDEKGNVIFSYEALVDPALVSYRREIERISPSVPTTFTPPVVTASSTVATSSPTTSTSTATTTRTTTGTSTPINRVP